MKVGDGVYFWGALNFFFVSSCESERNIVDIVNWIIFSYVCFGMYGRITGGKFPRAKGSPLNIIVDLYIVDLCGLTYFFAFTNIRQNA